MYDISLISTVHSKKGLCNPNELYKIIEQVSPELIFEEQSPEGYSLVYKGLREDSLESFTIKKYKSNHSITHLPVDLDGNKLIDLALKKDIINMMELFKKSPDYTNLSIQHEMFSTQKGFNYLNSNQCIEILERINSIESNIVNRINDSKLSQTYDLWLDINDKRENEMLKNIYDYSKLNKYKTALFLVGAAHRKSIIEKISNIEANNQFKLNWITNIWK